MLNFKKVLTIGGATLDTIIKYECMETMQIHKKNIKHSYALLEEGAKIEVTEQNCFSGGGATNAAVVFKKLGYDVSFFGKVGDDAPGTSILRELNGIGIDTTQAKVTKEHGTANSYVIPSLEGDRMVFAYRGANTSLLEDDLPKDLIAGSDFVYVTSLSKESAARLPDIVDIAEESNVKVAINPGISQLVLGSGFLRDALYGVDILILNLEEAKQFMLSLISIDDNLKKAINISDSSLREKSLLDRNIIYEDMQFSLRHFIKEILRMGPNIVVVTDGSNGVHVGTKSALYYHSAIKVPVINTLGAGDSFGSSFVGGIYSNRSIEESIKLGLVNSASVIGFPDAKTGILEKDDLMNGVNRIPNDMFLTCNW